MTSQQRLAVKFSPENLVEFKKHAPDQAYSFMKDYSPDDIYCISIPGNSTSTWQISPPSISNLKKQLTDPEPVELDFVYALTRESSEEQNEQLSETVTASKQSLLFNETKALIYNTLANASETNSVQIKKVYPRYIHARAKGNLLEIESLKNSGFLSFFLLEGKFKNLKIWKIKTFFNSRKFQILC